MSENDLERAKKDLHVVAERCLAKYDDITASLDVRAFSLSILISQISSSNPVMLTYVPEICRRLTDHRDDCVHMQLTSDDLARLMPPLIDVWKSPWKLQRYNGCFSRLPVSEVEELRDLLVSK